jgi:mono/diheme cytochrome c family protein
MMKYALLGPVVMTAAALAMVTAPSSAQQSPSVSEGARVYGSMCGRCHNPRSPLEYSDRHWTVIINHMRVRGNLTGGQVRNVLAFLQASNTDPRERTTLPVAPPIPSIAIPGDTTLSTDPTVIARGGQLTRERACLGCHVVEGEGGAVGPSLDDVIARRGAAFVMQKLVDPTFNNSTSMMPNFGLTPDEIRAMASYLATLRRP